MARMSGPDFIMFHVRDLEASTRFYTEQLGLVRTPEQRPGVVIFQTQPIPFAIRTALVDLDASPHLGWGTALWFACDDANALHAALAAGGVPIVQEPFDSPFGRTFVFQDPNGYTITAHSQAQGA